MCGNMQRLAASGERYTHMDRSTLPELDSELCEFTVSSSRVDSSTSKSSAPSVRVVGCASRESRGRLTPSFIAGGSQVCYVACVDVSATNEQLQVIKSALATALRKLPPVAQFGACHPRFSVPGSAQSR